MLRVPTMSSSRPNGRSPRCTPYENALHDLREISMLELASPGADTEARYRKLLLAAALVSDGMGTRLLDAGIDVSAIHEDLFGDPVPDAVEADDLDELEAEDVG